MWYREKGGQARCESGVTAELLMWLEQSSECWRCGDLWGADGAHLGAVSQVPSQWEGMMLKHLGQMLLLTGVPSLVAPSTCSGYHSTIAGCSNGSLRLTACPAACPAPIGSHQPCAKLRAAHLCPADCTSRMQLHLASLSTTLTLPQDQTRSAGQSFC